MAKTKQKTKSTGKPAGKKPSSKAQQAAEERDEALRERGKALAHRLLLNEKKKNRRKWEESLIKEFLVNPEKFANENYPDTTREDAREIACHAMIELKHYQGILHTHSAMSQAGTVLNTVRWMHLTTFIIGNILLIGTVVFILLAVLGVIPKEKIPINGTGLYAALGSTGGVGVVLNILYFVWVGPALKIRKALSDTAQLEMSYKTYTLVLNNLDRLHKRKELGELLWNDNRYKADPIKFVNEVLKGGGTAEEKAKLLQAVGEVLSKLDLKDSLMVFTKELVHLMEQVSEPKAAEMPKLNNILKMLEEAKKKE